MMVSSGHSRTRVFPTQTPFLPSKADQAICANRTTTCDRLRRGGTAGRRHDPRGCKTDSCQGMLPPSSLKPRCLIHRMECLVDDGVRAEGDSSWPNPIEAHLRPLRELVLTTRTTRTSLC